MGNFSEVLERFLRGAGVSHPLLHVVIETAKYPVYKQFTVIIPSLPQVTSEPFISDAVCVRGQPGATILVSHDLERSNLETFKWWDIDCEWNGTVLTTTQLTPCRTSSHTCLSGFQASRRVPIIPNTTCIH